jgi:phosphoserine phosphatase
MKHFSSYRLVKPPQTIRRGRVQLDNLALVPASLLPFKELYQQEANRLPTGAVLIVLPASPQYPRQVCERVATQLKAKGHQVSILSSALYQPARRIAPKCGITDASLL